MSNLVQALVWYAEFPNPIAKLIAVKLADWADDEGRGIYPKVRTMQVTTGCGRATVCKWQYALEFCGLLKVVERGGGADDGSTERAIDIDLLKRLVCPNKKTAPELRLVLDVVEHQARNKKDGTPQLRADGSPKLVKVTVFRIEPYETREGANDNRALQAGVPPVHHVDVDRPPRGRQPVHVVDPNPL